jgi:hypothetical protein
MGCGIIYKNLRERIDLKELYTEACFTENPEKSYEPEITHEG